MGYVSRPALLPAGWISTDWGLVRTGESGPLRKTYWDIAYGQRDTKPSAAASSLPCALHTVGRAQPFARPRQRPRVWLARLRPVPPPLPPHVRPALRVQPYEELVRPTRLHALALQLHVWRRER